MSSTCLVINEWLLHNLGGDYGRQGQQEGLSFLKRLKEKGDRIAVLVDSPWIRKAFQLMRHGDVWTSSLSKYLHTAILFDLSACRILYKNEIMSLPDELKSAVPIEDLYLVETYYSAGADVLVTTDKKLYTALSSIEGIHVMLKEDFLKQYLSK